MTLEQIDFFLMAVRCDTFLEAAGKSSYRTVHALETDPEARD